MKQFTIILSLIFVCGCVTFKEETISKSTIKLEGKNTNIRELIDINGFYRWLPFSPIDASLIFFEDGTWVRFFWRDEVSEAEKSTNLAKSIKTWKQDKQTRWGVNWGIYTISNDTIIAHSYMRPGFLVPWSLSELRYKVIDRKTIKSMYFKNLLLSEDEYNKMNNISFKQEDVFLYFTPADSIPPSDSWLKENKWIWRNETDWKEYMQKIKLKKKQ